jgi:hypothetical protein
MMAGKREGRGGCKSQSIRSRLEEEVSKLTALLDVSEDIEARLTYTRSSGEDQALYRARVSMESKHDRLVDGKDRVEGALIQSVRVASRTSKDQEIDDIDYSDPKFRRVLLEQLGGMQDFLGDFNTGSNEDYIWILPVESRVLLPDTDSGNTVLLGLFR